MSGKESTTYLYIGKQNNLNVPIRENLIWGIGYMGVWRPTEHNVWESKIRLETRGSPTSPKTRGTHERVMLWELWSWWSIARPTLHQEVRHRGKGYFVGERVMGNSSWCQWVHWKQTVSTETVFFCELNP